MSQNNNAPVLFAHPFSKAYWKQAASEFKKTKVLVFAALMIALRVVLKMVSIPIGVDMRINTAFIVNAFGAMTFGPVVSIVAAAISDTLGCILFPTGVYFFPLVFVEIAGSLFYALCFYRARLTTGRVLLSAFLINFGVNIIISTPLMVWYYDMILGKSYAWMQLPRIVKNLVEVPVESVILILLLPALISATKGLGMVHSDAQNLKFTKKTMVTLGALFLVGVIAVFGYSVYSYNTTSLSASYSGGERLEKNVSMQAHVYAENPQLEGETVVTVIESAYPKFRDPNVTYNVAVYTLNQAEFEANAQEKLAENPEAVYTMDTLNGYSKSKAKADDALTHKGYATIVLDKKTGALVSYADDFE